MHLGDMRTCIYDDGTVFAMEAGPCQDVLASGAYLVDDTTEAGGGVTRVTPDFPWTTVLLGIGLFALIAKGGR